MARAHGCAAATMSTNSSVELCGGGHKCPPYGCFDEIKLIEFVEKTHGAVPASILATASRCSVILRLRSVITA
jgi:hypothetical protein